MKKLLKKSQNINVVPEDIKGAMTSVLQSKTKDILELTIKEDNLSFYKKDDIVEVFTVVDEGMLYFKSTIEDILPEESILKLKFDEKAYDLLQRREFTRVEIKKEFTLKDENKDYVCSTIDISAGGMKIVTEAPLSEEKDYEIEFSLEGNIPIQCFFKPIRISELNKKSKQTKNVVSGRFIALKNIDKIAIVQYCFKKNLENTNK